MNIFYNKNSTIQCLSEYFAQYFQDVSNSVRRLLLWFVIAMITVESATSIRFLFTHILWKTVGKSLNCYYRVLKVAKLDGLPQLIVKFALSIISEYDAPIYLAVDDTLIEKIGKHFEKVKILFDHSKKKGLTHINGHCFVSFTVCIKVTNTYIAIPLGYKMWTGEDSKLSLASDFLDEIMPQFEGRKVILTFDAWYAKKLFISRALRHKNLEIICNVRKDTVLFEPEQRKTGKRGRPRKYGAKIKHLVGTQKVLTNLFGDKPVFATVVNSRLFLSTTYDFSAYSYRWKIEVQYYEQKIFWSLGDYRIRSKIAIENLLNLVNLVHASMKILPYAYKEFEFAQELTPQEFRFELSQLIRADLFFHLLTLRAQNTINSNFILKILRELYFTFRLSA